ncbi:MAG: diaminopimelate epimerase [Bacteroidetes bacterium MedPE-SWsnd-G2]|nr:MAG: diaminopimelate epimerase [Bacteroidetes bacterium MedPE-SWsnd-G2]
MKQQFFKYQGTGNDFVMIDNRDKSVQLTQAEINKLCDRRFGIGADGLILLEPHDTYSFKMVYFNSDGNESTMCGNGGRCLVAFARDLGVIENEASFEAIDGLHHAVINGHTVKLQMQDVDVVEQFENHSFLDTGSPHHVELVNQIENFDVKEKGEAIRYGSPYFKAGSNVNFVEQIDSGYYAVRTYERGVEDETLSCGTGVTAVAIAMFDSKHTTSNSVRLKVMGGELKVSFDSNNGKYTNVWLEGPAVKVFQGSI